MGTILEFRRSEDAAARIARPVEDSLGQIIIFPGVRIDRRASIEMPEHTGTPTGRRVRNSRKK
jgi:hypothetical protein